MGKRPVLGLVGLAWAGMLAAGCCGGSCSRSTRKDTPLPPPVATKTSSETGRFVPEGTKGSVVPVDSRGDIGYSPPPQKPLTDVPLSPAASPGMPKKLSALPPDAAAPKEAMTLKHASADLEHPREVPGPRIPPPPSRVVGQSRPAEELPAEPVAVSRPPSDNLPSENASPPLPGEGVPPPLPGSTPPPVPGTIPPPPPN